jgi:hypothetical protein
VTIRGLLAVCALVFAAPSLCQPAGCERADLESALDRVLRLKNLGNIYSEDAAADGSVVMVPPAYRVARPEIIPLLACEARAATVLVEHLDDIRLTSATFKGGTHWSHPARVPLGVLCLDILIFLSPFGSPIRDPETEDNDGLGAGVRAEYYFRPDDFVIKAGRYAPKPQVFAVKKAWQKALRDGLARFEYSDWHKGIR